MECRFAFDGAYITERNKDDHHSAISHFYNLNSSVLLAVGKSAFQYYQDITNQLDPDNILHDNYYVDIATEKDAWGYIQFCDVLSISRNVADDTVYICLGGDCDWDSEQGV